MTPGAPHQDYLAHSLLVAIDDHTEKTLPPFPFRHPDYPS